MFDFLKKSRAIRFLCSACLLCSLGSFATFAEDTSDDGANEPVTVGTLYYGANLGMTDKHIMLDETRATIDAKMSGTLKYYTETPTDLYSKGQITNVSLDEAWDSFLQNPGGFLNSAIIAAGYTVNQFNEEYSVYNQSGYNQTFNSYDDMVTAFMPILREITDDSTKKNILLAKQQPQNTPAYGWSVSTSLLPKFSTLSNNYEDAKLAFFLTLDDEYKAATKEIDLAENNDSSDSNPFELNDIQLYEATDNNIIKDESATEFSGPPGKYTVKAIVTKEGSTSIINGPVAKSSDKS